LSNGTEALALGLRALEVKAGDEVIVPANTFIATAEAVSLVGAVPVFVDVRRGTWLIDPDAVDAAVTSRTVGVIGVHLYGQPFDVDPLAAICARRGLWLMEDSAQAHLAEYKGKRTGTLAQGAAFSFYPGKNLGAPGEGGAFVTDSDDLARRVRLMRDHGQARKYHHVMVGCNARMPALMAATLQIKLPRLAAWNTTRRQHASRYLEGLAANPRVERPVEDPNCRGVYHLFVVHVNERERVFKAMMDSGIGCALHYPVPCHLQTCYQPLGYAPGACPNAEYNAAHCISLPMYPELTHEQIDSAMDTLSRIA